MWLCLVSDNHHGEVEYHLTLRKRGIDKEKVGGERGGKGRQRGGEEGGRIHPYNYSVLTNICCYHGDPFIDDNIADDGVWDECGSRIAAPVGGADMNTKTGHHDH